MKGEEASNCGGCGLGEQRFLLLVRNRGDYLHLCISCVLKFHPGLFCPVCFEVYDNISASNDRVKCLKCSSASHMECVSEDLRSGYVCPSCSNPSSVIFNFGKKRSGDGNQRKIIDVSLSKIFLAAARISVISMSKAVTACRIDSERRAKEAVLSKKRARESIERVVFLRSKAKEMNPSVPLTIPSPVALTEPKKKSKGYSAVSAAVAAQKRIQNQYRAMGNSKMGIVGVASNNVLRKNEGLVRLNAPNVSQRPSTKVVATKKISELQSPDKVNDKKSSNLAHLLTRVLHEEKDKNGVSSSPTTARQQQNAPLDDHDIEMKDVKLIEKKEVKSKPVTASGKTKAN